MSFRKILSFLIFLLSGISILFYFTFKKPKLMTVSSPLGNFSVEVFSANPWYLSQEQYRIKINDSIQDTTLISFSVFGDSMQVSKVIWSDDERLLGIVFKNNRFMIYDVFMETFVLDRLLFPEDRKANQLTRLSFTSRGDSISFEFLNDDKSLRRIRIPIFPSGKL